MTTVVNIHHGATYDVYIGRGRGSKLGNPFSHLAGTLAQFRVSSRKESIRRFRLWVPDQPVILASLPDLNGKRLGCFCKPLECHGNVYVELVELMVRLGHIPTREEILDYYAEKGYV